MKTATRHVRNEPAKVSILPYLISFMSRPLSTTALCWKKICQGVMVVPMLAMMTKSRSAVRPLGKLGMVKPLERPLPRPGRSRPHGPEGSGDVDEIEDAEEKGYLLEGPVLPREHDAEKYKR